jgi:hypothetical protein
MYCPTVYGMIKWKLKRTPMQTIISDVNRICLKQKKYDPSNNYEK